jgi:hypothetical protein
MIDSGLGAYPVRRAAISHLLACLCAGTILFGAPAFAQQSGPPPAENAAPASQNPAPPAGSPSFFAGISQWFEQQVANLRSALQDTGSKVETISNHVGSAAKSSADVAKDAADAVVRIPATRLVSGNEQCMLAANGAPDCVAAATAMCKAKGFASGKSTATTAAEACKAEVYLAGRNRGPGCHTETFVTTALCQ